MKFLEAPAVSYTPSTQRLGASLSGGNGDSNENSRDCRQLEDAQDDR